MNPPPPPPNSTKMPRAVLALIIAAVAGLILLVLVAVIAVIAAIAIPHIAGAKESAMAAQSSYETTEFESLSNQLRALGYTGPITLEDLKAGITVSVPDSDGTAKELVFKMNWPR